MCSLDMGSKKIYIPRRTIDCTDRNESEFMATSTKADTSPHSRNVYTNSAV